mgnify:FL=1
MKSILTIALIIILATYYSYSQDTIVDPFEIPAEFPGGDNAMYCFIEKQLNYSKLVHIEYTGRLFITFTIERNGKIENIEINPEYLPRREDIVTDSIVIAEIARVIGLMPDWTPARLQNTPIRSKFFLPFILPYSNFKCPDFKTDSDIVTDPDNLPVFPIGEAKTNKERVSAFINSNVEWPRLQLDCQGWVFVQAVIEKTGELTNVRLIRQLCPGFNEEALRVVKNMPDWKLGIKNGEPVRTVTVIPIYFVLH